MLGELFNNFMSVASLLKMATFAPDNFTVLLAVVDGESFTTCSDHSGAMNHSQPVCNAMSSIRPPKNDFRKLLCLVALRLDFDVSRDLEMRLAIGASTEGALRLKL